MTYPTSTLTGFLSELEKIASHKPGAYGALVGGTLSAAGSYRRERKMKAMEDAVLKDKPELLKKDPSIKRKLTKNRVKRVLGDLVVGTATGGILGHAAGKGVKGLASTAKEVIDHADGKAKGIVNHAEGKLQRTWLGRRLVGSPGKK